MSDWMNGDIDVQAYGNWMSTAFSIRSLATLDPRSYAESSSQESLGHTCLIGVFFLLAVYI